MKHVHLIGIGGFGLSAIARILLERGYTISGSDSHASPVFMSIEEAGAVTFLGHNTVNIAGADLVIRSSAIPDANPEVVAAFAKGIPVYKRSDFLAELTQGQEALAVAGSHGKTTTTAMLIWILNQLGMDPSFIAGGMVKQLNTNAHSGTGQFFVIEADEYDRMFLGLTPKIAIITNIEHDHPDCFPTRDEYHQAFKAFLEKLQPDGAAIVCLDDPEARALATQARASGKTIFGYGVDQQADYFVDQIRAVGNKMQFQLYLRRPGMDPSNLGKITLQIPGHHNVLNAAAVISTIHHLGLPLKESINALSQFTGVGRRFDILGTANQITVIDDYGHHPTEIRATLEAANVLYPNHKIWAVWQPHTFTRTKGLDTEFIRALDFADQVVVLPIFAAREKDPGYSSRAIVRALPDEKAVYMEDFDAAHIYLLNHLDPGDMMIVFSAGDATKISQDVLKSLKENEVQNSVQEVNHE